MTPHPLSALTADEITVASDVVRSGYENNTKIRSKGISLHEPTKGEILKHRQSGHPLPRKAWVNYYLTGTVS
jgi:Cu2+-containing amine oxidase